MAHIDLDLDIFVYSEFDILLLSDVELARIAQANRFNSFRFSTPAITAHRQVLNRRRLVEDNRRRVRDCIQTREDWLTSKNFPKDMKMRTDERAAFVKHCKDKFHAEPDQLRQQQRDFAEGGANLRKNKKNSRWARHMQIEMGSKQLWEVVSFTGNSDSTLHPQWFLVPSGPTLYSHTQVYI
jgi:hypothetical protein